MTEEAETLAYEVTSSPQLGRFLVASKRIPAGGVILRETPLAAAPADTEENPQENLSTCLGCFRLLTDQSSNSCRACGWPLCGEACAQILHHRENECRYFQENEINFPLPGPTTNKTILVFRCLLLKTRNPEGWAELTKFEHHNEKRARKRECAMSDERILRDFEYFFRRKLTEENRADIVMLCGIINVNAFTSLKREDQNSNRISQCVYRTASLFTHSCVPNASWLISDPPNLVMTVRAAVDIEVGQMITIPYSTRENLAGTLQRLVSTEEVAHFQCRCRRCRDPTELKTYISAIRCLHHPPCPGFLLSLDPMNAESGWKCREISRENEDKTEVQSCGAVVPVGKIVSILYKAEEELERMKRNIPQVNLSLGLNRKYVCNFLGLKCAWERIFHENHYLVQEIIFIIVKQMSRDLEALNEHELDCFIDSCERLLAVADVITPGFSRHRVMLEFQLAKGLQIKLKREVLSKAECVNDSAEHDDAESMRMNSSWESLTGMRLNDLKQELSLYCRNFGVEFQV